MLRGSGRTSSVIQAAGSRGAGASPLPNALVVLVKTKRGPPAATASSSSTSVPSMLVCTKSSRRCDPTCGLCSVAVCSTASTPSMQRRTQPRSATEPTTVVYRDARTSSPMTSTSSSPSTRISASPRWPELPVTRTRMHHDLSESVRTDLLELRDDRRLVAALPDVARELLERRQPRQRRRVTLGERNVHERALVEAERRVAKAFRLSARELLVHRSHERLILGLAAGLHAIAHHHLTHLNDLLRFR